jgi:hypothetical protein
VLTPWINDAFRALAVQADDNPSYAVVASWSLFESAMTNALEMIWLDPRNARRGFPRSGAAVLNELTRMKVLTPETHQAVGSLRGLRNEVAHGAVNPEPGAAAAYVQNVQAMAEAIWRSVVLLREARTFETAEVPGPRTSPTAAGRDLNP